MPKFIKLNTFEKEIWYININSIISMNVEPYCTRIATNDCYLSVEETPEEILKLIAECEDN